MFVQFSVIANQKECPALIDEMKEFWPTTTSSLAYTASSLYSSQQQQRLEE
jgi:hypothetical protein